MYWRTRLATSPLSSARYCRCLNNYCSTSYSLPSFTSRSRERAEMKTLLLRWNLPEERSWLYSFY